MSGECGLQCVNNYKLGISQQQSYSHFTHRVKLLLNCYAAAVLPTPLPFLVRYTNESSFRQQSRHTKRLIVVTSLLARCGL